MFLHVVVRGRVQGVGFRWFVRESARRLRVSGWVKNCEDGSVEVAASGDDAAIRAFRSAIGSGPQGGSVTSVDDIELVTNELPYPFSILR